MSSKKPPQNIGLILKCVAAGNLFGIAALWLFRNAIGLEIGLTGILTGVLLAGIIVDITILQRIQTAKDRK